MTKETQNQITRPPIVVVLGHIDHGKTSLLWAIRKLKVPAGKPEGAITQHIGAYQIEENGKKITFIDTPGHEAFSQMRSRGAKVADIAILVVAADESIKPQTKEAILHIKKAELPLIIAINKMDKSEADPEKVKRDLAKEDILVESMGGKFPAVEISAKTGKGIEDLLELILLLAEMEGLKADISLKPQGVVIESYLDQLRGPAASLILSQGKLEQGVIIGTFSAFGKIKSLEDFQGKSIAQALPSQPVLVLGFENPPRVGEEFQLFLDRQTAEINLKIGKEKVSKPVVIEPGKKVLNIILKADVLGSLEAIQELLQNLPQEQIPLNTLKAEVGEITVSDIKLASRDKAIVLGFRVKINPATQVLLQREKTRVMQFDIIYDLAEAVRKYMTKLTEPTVARTDLGKMKVLKVFLEEKNRQIIGGRITEGRIKKGAFIEIFRTGELKGKGKIIGLQKNKKDIDEASKTEEVGILFEGSGKIEQGDILTIYAEQRQKGEL